jgi:hypothetical protein
MAVLSKSKYLAGLQCPRLLWFHFNEPDVIPDYDDQTQAIFDQGHRVGEVAKECYPDGLEIEWGDFMETIRKTKDYLSWRLPIFEASFLHDDEYCRVDILVPNGDGWNIIEVKSSTRVKDVHVQDVAFQTYVLRGEGLDIKKTYVSHIDRDYVKDGEIEPKGLLAKRDITDEVEDELDDVPEKVASMWRTIGKEAPPEPDVGPQGSTPYDCALEDECCCSLPEYNVTELYYIGDRAYELTDEGIYTIANVPDEFRLTEKQERQREAVEEAEPVVLKHKITSFLDKLDYPLYCLDFESYRRAIPLVDGTRPYQQIPFQFSLHVMERDGSVEHHEFIGDSEDPRGDLAEALHVIGDEGSLVAYNASFERRVLESLADETGDEWLRGLCDRFIDVHVPFKNFWYYHPDQRGSTSLKTVLPLLSGEDYEAMDIADGDAAARTYIGAVLAGELDAVREPLLEYCKQDTYALVVIVEKLRELTRMS